MVRRMLVKLGIRTIVLMFTVSTQYAFAADGLLPQINEVRIGASATPNAELQILFSPIPTIARPYNPNLAWLFTPRPLIGASISLQGKTSDAYAGLVWSLPIYDRFFAEFSLGGLIHNQNLDQYYSDRPSPLSTRVLFRESIAIGYQINDYWRIVAFADHGSNGNLGYRNESLNHYGVLLGKKFTPSGDKSIKADPDLFAFNWAGPYTGFAVALARSKYDLLSPQPSDLTSRKDSVNLAAQVGDNWAIGRAILGGEVDYAVQGLSGSANVNAMNSAYAASSYWMVTARARLGTEVAISYLSDRSLIYATGGAAISRISNGYCPNASVQCYIRPAIDIGGGWSDQGAVRTGWTAGGGLEVPLARTVSAKFEYLYVDFGSFGFTNGAVSNEISFSEHILRTGLNFKLN